MVNSESEVQECNPGFRLRLVGKGTTLDDSSTVAGYIDLILVFVFIIIARALTGEIGFQIYHSYYYCFIVALCVYNAYPLFVFCNTFYCITGASCILQVAFIIIYFPIPHYFLHFRLRNFSALHSALSMVAILQQISTTVKAFIPVRRISSWVFRPVGVGCYFGFRRRVLAIFALFDDNNGYQHQQYQYVWSPFLVQNR
jgi:hypothetical protein